MTQLIFLFLILFLTTYTHNIINNINQLGQLRGKGKGKLCTKKIKKQDQNQQSTRHFMWKTGHYRKTDVTGRDMRRHRKLNRGAQPLINHKASWYVTIAQFWVVQMCKVLLAVTKLRLVELLHH